MKTTEIGSVTLGYNEQGEFLGGYFKSYFTPWKEGLVKDNPGAEILVKGFKNSLGKTEDSIKSQSEEILSAWFTRMNEVEFADKFESKITSEISNCVKWPSGDIKEVTVLFTLKNLKDEQEVDPVLN